MEEEWVDVNDNDEDWGDEGVVDDDYDEDKFQKEYEEYMKSLSKSSTGTNKTTPSSSTTTTTNNTKPTSSATTTTTEAPSEKKDVVESKNPSSGKHHHHKRNVAHLKDHHQTTPTSSPPIKSSPTTTNTVDNGNQSKTTTTASVSTSNTTATTTTAVAATTASTTTTTTTATVPPSTQPEQQQPLVQNERRTYEKKNIKQHKPQDERKKHRSETETIEFMKILLNKLLSSYDKIYASTRLTPEIYENTRHKLLKNFSFHKNSETMQASWVDILFEKVLERGIAGTIASLLNEQLEENVSRLPQDVIVSIKKKIAAKCQQLFSEQFTVQKKENELEEEFQFYKKKSNSLKLVAKLVSYHVLDKKIAFFVLNGLLSISTDINLKLCCEFLLEVGHSIDSPTNKTKMDEIVDKITKLSKDEKIAKSIRLDLLKVVDSRERNKFANIDEQFMFIQQELKVIQLENELAELTEKPSSQTSGTPPPQQQRRHNHQ